MTVWITDPSQFPSPARRSNLGLVLELQEDCAYQHLGGIRKFLLAQYRRFEQEHDKQMRILNRLQENFDDFYNAVIKLRNQQQNPYVKEQLIEIMRGNLKPSLTQIMFSVSLKTLSEFCREVRRAENLLAIQSQMYQRSSPAQRVHELYSVEDEQTLLDLEVDGIRPLHLLEL